MRDIAKCISDTKLFSGLAGAFALVACAVSLAGCMGTGLGLADASGIDKVNTGSIPAAAANPALVDAAVVQSAVSTADVANVPGNPIPWANAASGSAGVISSIREEAVGTSVCRRFTTTRHSYQGIAKFDGNTCRAANGAWTLTSFAPRS